SWQAGSPPYGASIPGRFPWHAGIGHADELSVLVAADRLGYAGGGELVGLVSHAFKLLHHLLGHLLFDPQLVGAPLVVKPRARHGLFQRLAEIDHTDNPE